MGVMRATMKGAAAGPDELPGVGPAKAAGKPTVPRYPKARGLGGGGFVACGAGGRGHRQIFARSLVVACMLAYVSCKYSSAVSTASSGTCDRHGLEQGVAEATVSHLLLQWQRPGVPRFRAHPPLGRRSGMGFGEVPPPAAARLARPWSFPFSSRNCGGIFLFLHPYHVGCVLAAAAVPWLATPVRGPGIAATRKRSA